MSNRRFAAKGISLFFLIASLVVAWQAVRFCQGDVGAPIVDQVQSGIQDVVGGPLDAAPASPIAAWFAWQQKALLYMGGVAIWLFLAVLVRAIGGTLSRVVEVGWSQYLDEARQAAAEEVRQSKIFAERQRRKDARRKREEATRPKSTLGFGTLLVGICIGKLF